MRTACIFHRVDLDGWMSAAIVKHWFLNSLQSNESYLLNGTRYDCGGDVHCVCKSINFIGFNYGDSIPDLSEYDRVIMCDISFPKEEMKELNARLGLNFIWIDHHISALKENEFTVRSSGEIEMSLYHGNFHTKFAACELTWSYLFHGQPMPEIVRLLGRYDCFGHKGKEEEQKVLEFQYGARNRIIDYQYAYEYLTGRVWLNGINDADNVSTILSEGKAIYSYLCTDAKQSYKNGFEILFIMTPNGEMPSFVPNVKRFICINKERFNPINFGIKYHEDGYDGCACFHMGPDKMLNFSLYNDDGKVDVSVIAKQFGGGGHAGAAGFRISMNRAMSLFGVEF